MISKSIQLSMLYEYAAYVLQLTENCKEYILEDLHSLGGKNMLNMCDLFEDDYKEFDLIIIKTPALPAHTHTHTLSDIKYYVHV